MKSSLSSNVRASVSNSKKVGRSIGSPWVAARRYNE
jgi:hypothetical protein